MRIQNGDLFGMTDFYFVNHVPFNIYVTAVEEIVMILVLIVNLRVIMIVAISVVSVREHIVADCVNSVIRRVNILVTAQQKLHLRRDVVT